MTSLQLWCRIVAAAATAGCLALCGCQQMAAANSAVKAVQTAQAIATTAPSVAQNALQGAQATAAATTQKAVEVANSVPGGPLALSMVPQSVIDQLNQLLNVNNWTGMGKPAVYAADGRYFFIYPSGGLLPGGKPRIVIVDTMTPVARLERLRKSGY